jgi:hypothetical protein
MPKEVTHIPRTFFSDDENYSDRIFYFVFLLLSLCLPCFSAAYYYL